MAGKQQDSGYDRRLPVRHKRLWPETPLLFEHIFTITPCSLLENMVVLFTIESWNRLSIILRREGKPIPLTLTIAVFGLC